MNKLKGFTLIEIIIALVLITILYLFAINNFNLEKGKSQDSISLLTLKKELLSQDYTDNITIKCIEEDFSCFVFLDYELQEDKIKNLFKNKPTVYEYSKNLDLIEFNTLELEKLDSYDVIFEYSCNKQQKCTEEIVFVKDKGYIFNDIHLKPIVVNSNIEIEDYFQDKIQEVKNAF